MKETNSDKIVVSDTKHVFDSLYCSFCSLKFSNGFCLEIITKITETKFSCPLGRTTKCPFSPAQEQLKLTAPGKQVHFFLALPAKTTHVSSFTNSLSCILQKKNQHFFWWFLFVSHCCKLISLFWNIQLQVYGCHVSFIRYWSMTTLLNILRASSYEPGRPGWLCFRDLAWPLFSL